MIFQLIVGVVMAYAGFYGDSPFSPILFVEGMIVANMAILGRIKKKSLNHI